MTNIEKLAINNGAVVAGDYYERFVEQGSIYFETKEQLEAFAQALQSSEPVGYARVPIVPTKEMNQLMSEEDWEWKDLLAVAEAITEEQYNTSTISLEEHSKRIAELEADIDTYVPIANQQATEIVQLQATNKTLLDALKKIASETQDTNLLWWQKEARQAIADAEGVEG